MKLPQHVDPMALAFRFRTIPDTYSRRNLSNSLAMILAVLAILLYGSKSLPAAEAQRPNVVMIFIDDMGWGDFSCFGNNDARTPNIDRLAAEGLRFTQFYVNAPICSPPAVR